MRSKWIHPALLSFPDFFPFFPPKKREARGRTDDRLTEWEEAGKIDIESKCRLFSTQLPLSPLSITLAAALVKGEEEKEEAVRYYSMYGTVGGDCWGGFVGSFAWGLERFVA